MKIRQMNESKGRSLLRQLREAKELETFEKNRTIDGHKCYLSLLTNRYAYYFDESDPDINYVIDVPSKKIIATGRTADDKWADSMAHIVNGDEEFVYSSDFASKEAMLNDPDIQDIFGNHD